MKQLKFLETKRTPRYSLRKFSVGMVSVLLGVTIFGINFTNHSVKAATTNGNSQQTSAVVLTTAERTNTQKATSATEEVQQNSVSNDVTEKVQQNVASNDATANNSTEAATTLQSAPKTQGSASKNATANNSTEAATTLQSAPKTQGSAGSGASGSSATGVASGSQASNSQAARTTSSAATDSQTVSVDEAKSPAVQSRILMMNLAVVNPNTEDTTLPKSTQTYTLVTQPLLTDYLNHLHDGKRDGKTWVDKTLKYYPNATMDTIFGTTSKPGIITSHPDKYFFGAYVDYNSSYHRVILLARSQNPIDHNLYSYTIHTGIQQNTSSTIAVPNTDTQEVYGGASGSKYDLIFKNYQGKSYAVVLKGFEHGDGEYGLLPVFDGGLLDPTYYSNDYYKNDTTAKTKSIGFWGNAIPQETSTKVRYVDQATGKDIVQPMEISGFGYQGFKVNGEAPTVKGYHLVSKPKFLGLAYEDGTIAPYKVGQTYDLALSDSVVIKQTVIHTDGTVRATAYYKGSPLSTYYKGRLISTSTSKILGRESDNDQMSFVTPDGKFHTYTNRIGQVDDSYIYYYAKDSDPNGSEMRLHFIDVTGVNNSSYAPSDGPELDADKVKTIHGNIGDNYSFTYTVPTNYYEVGSSDVTGKYSGTRHDAYVYVKKQAENKLYAPVAGDPLTVEQGTTLTTGQAKAAVKYKGDVPSDATYAWDPKTPVDTTAVGPHKTNVIVTYGDSTTSPVPVTVNVVAKTDKSKYTVAAGKPVTLTHGQKVKEGDSLDSSAVTLKDAKGQAVSLPDGAKVVWTTAPDTSEVGNDEAGQVKVVYGNNSESEPVDVTYNVVPNQADKNDAKAKDGLTTDLNKVPAAKDSVTVTDEKGNQVKDFEAEWAKDKTPDVSKPGKSTGTVAITYPDGSKETVDVPVTVRDENGKTQADKNDAKAKDGLTTDLNKVPAAKDSVTVTDEKGNQVKDFEAEWAKDKTPDVSKPGKSTGTVAITYPDGSKETVDVPVTVRDENGKTQADKNDAKAKDGLTTDLNKVPAAKDSVTVTDEKGNQVKDFEAEWAKDKTPDVSKPGKSTGTVAITYPDGSKETVDVPVTVRDENGKTQADKNDAKAKDGLTTDLNKVPAAKDSVTVTDEKGNQVKDFEAEWAKDKTPDVSKPGKSTGTVAITYPDGSKETVDVPVTVRDENGKTQADKNDAKAKDGLTTDLNKVPAAKDSVTVTDEKGNQVKDFEAEWAKDKTPDVSKPGKSTGTVAITYPDGSKETVDVPVTVRDENGKTQADKNDAKAKDGLTTDLNKVPAAKDSVTVTDEKGNQVKDFEAEWAKDKTPDVSKPGKSTGTVAITYPDGSKETVDVPVTVRDENGKTQADKNDAKAKDGLTTDLNKVPAAKDSVTVTDEKGNQVKDFEAEWAKDKTPDVSKPGKSTGTVAITYPDGSKETVDVPVTVRDENGKTQADKNDAKAKDGLTTDLNKVPAAKDSVTVTDEKGNQVKDFEAEWAKDKTPDVSKPGKSTGTVAITYPDGSKETVDVPVTVRDENGKTQADKNDAKAKDGLTTDLNKVPAAKDSVTVTDEKGNQVKDFEAEWAKDKTPDVSKPGKSTGTVAITYPDGSKETVDVPVTVRDENGKTQADKNDAKAKDGLTTDLNKVPAAKDSVTVTDEKGNQVKDFEAEWAKDKTPDVSKPGKSTGTVAITYPDGSKETVDVPVTVRDENGKTQADKNDAKAKDGLTTDLNKVPAAKDSVTVTDEKGNQVKDFEAEWAKDKTPDVSKPGKSTGTVAITYPDGSKETVDVPVTVRDENGKTQADKNDAKAKDGLTTDLNKVPAAKDSVTVTDEKGNQVKDFEAEWAKDKTPDVSKPGKSTGTVAITYPDGSKETVDVPVTVRDENGKTQADKNDAKAKDGLTTDLNKVPAAKDSVTVTDEKGNQVKDFEAEWAKDKTPDVSKPGKSTGTVAITYPDGSKETVDVPVTVRDENGKTQADKNDAKAKDGLTTDLNKVPAAKDSVTVTDEKGNQVKDFEAEWAKDKTPDVSKPGKSTGTVAITYPDGSKETVDVPVTVRDENGKTQADKNDAKAKDGLTTDLNKVPAAKDSVTVTDEKGNQVKDFEAEWAKDKTPDVSKPGKSTGTVAITYPDGSKETVDVPVTVRDENGKTQADKNDAKAKDGLTTDLNKVPAAKDSVTVTDEKGNQVKDFEAEWAKDKTPDVSKPGKSTGTVAITYPDGSKETVDVPVTVRDENGKTQADKNDAKAKDGLTTDLNKVPAAKDSVTVTDEKGNQVKDFEAEWAKDKTPDVSKPGKSTGTVAITYPDGSKETVDVPVTVRDENGKTQADKNDAKAKDGLTTDLNKVPAAKDSVTVTDEKGNQVKDFEAEWAKDKTPDVSKPGKSTGTVAITYPDGSKETVDVPVTVRDENGKTQADKNDAKAKDGLTTDLNKVPAAKDSVTVTDEKGNQVKDFEAEWAKDKTPDVSKPGKSTGTVAITYPDGSKETVDVPVTVRDENGKTQADKNDAKAKDGLTTDLNKVPAAKDSVTVTDEKGNQVKDFEAEWAKDKTPDVSKPGKSTGTVAITYPDGSKETVDVPVTVRDENGKTQADKNDPKTPGNKVEVDDPAKLTDDEKKDVVKAVEDANKDDNGNSTLPDGTKITVGDNGDVTVTYPDGSEDTIPGDKVVEGKTDADKTDVTVPGTKVEVGDPTKLTDGEKGQVEEAIKDANPNLPDGTKITVADDGTATIKYPDGSQDTISGDQLVQGQKGDTTDAGNITPTVPGDKVTVKDPSHLTDDEKNQVKNNVDNANKDKFPAGTEVTVGDDGTATIKYPDGSQDTIPGDQLVQGQKGDTTDAGNITPTVPGGKVTVKDPSHLTDSEKDQVKKNVEDANKGNFPDGTEITVGDDGTATVTYPDGSKDVIAGTDLIIAAKGEDVLGSKYHSHKNGSNSSQADRVKGASTANGSIANAGNNLGVKAESDNAFVGVKAESDNAFVGVKGESDNAIGNNKATSLKTLPQTGTKDTSILGVLGMLLASLGLFGFKKKRDKE